MNKRQNIALYVSGVLLAGISWYQGERQGEWLFEVFIPVLIIATLVIYALRTKGQDAVEPAEVLKKGLGVLGAVVLLAYCDGRFQNLSYEIEAVSDSARDAASSAEEVRSEVERLELEQMYRR